MSQGRAYTAEQVSLVSEHQSAKHALSTEIAYSAGLRASELYTLRLGNNSMPIFFPVLDSKWKGRDGIEYTVTGNGGVHRKVLLPKALSERLEVTRLPQPIEINDRGVHYYKKYDIGGGHAWSNSFSGASNRVLGWSAGSFGVRYSYAQERMEELCNAGVMRKKAKETVSQELGISGPEKLNTYLR